MSLQSNNNKRIAKNTLFLYFRMFFMMGVSLYTSHVTLNALGVEDFGIYNVVGGVMAMLSVISGALSAAISRFITCELGKADKMAIVGRCYKCFYDSNNMHLQGIYSIGKGHTLSTNVKYCINKTSKR